MGQRHKHADVIIAWAEGKDVQIWSPATDRWQDLTKASPHFLEENEYRIKPPAKKYRVALFANNINTYICIAETPEDANYYESTHTFVRWLTDWIEYEE